MKLTFAKKKMTFAKLETDFLCEIEFRYGGNEFRLCTIDSLFGKVELHVGHFPFCSGGIDIHFPEIRWKRYSTACHYRSDQHGQCFHVREPDQL